MICVDRNLSIDSAKQIQNITVWESDLYEHNAHSEVKVKKF